MTLTFFVLRCAFFLLLFDVNRTFGNNKNTLRITAEIRHYFVCLSKEPFDDTQNQDPKHVSCFLGFGTFCYFWIRN